MTCTEIAFCENFALEFSLEKFSKNHILWLSKKIDIGHIFDIYFNVQKYNHFEILTHLTFFIAIPVFKKHRNQK